MKIVNKYELALMPAGTAFYVLDENGFIGKGSEKGLLILESDTFYGYDGKPMFNGVCYLEPDHKEGSYGCFREDELPDQFELFCVDTDSNDFTDEDKFLVLEPEELKMIIDYLQNCYERSKQ